MASSSFQSPFLDVDAKSTFAELGFTRRYTSYDAPPPLTRSASGIIQPLSFKQLGGDSGTMVSVQIRIKPILFTEISTRLLFGQRAVATTVHEFPSGEYWDVTASAPPRSTSSGFVVPISVQLLDPNDAVIETAPCGEFAYSKQEETAFEEVVATSPVAKISRFSRSGTPVYRIPNDVPIERLLSETLDDPPVTHHPQISRRPKLNSSPSDNDLTPILQLLTPLENMVLDWTAEERRQGRRLVKFRKVQEGRTLIVSCEPITLEEYRETDTVISCILRPETDACFVTSVDIIALLEKLTNDEFPVDEKNRIRRNLEGLRPITVSKHKRGFERFFQRIMGFPHPKPRNIEKDVKVFAWELLNQALYKILSKYTIIDLEIPAHELSRTDVEPTLVPSIDDTAHDQVVVPGQKSWYPIDDPPYMPMSSLAASDPSDSDTSLSLLSERSQNDWTSRYEKRPTSSKEPLEEFTYLCDV
ncbi:hypothetical protein ONZ45_g14042 [Pleurotus djamor]|nr:hypothetical protein ONZ45_g14042 [Pleurotus djamor]